MEIVGIISIISGIILFLAIMSFDYNIIGIIGSIIAGLLFFIGMYCAIDSKSEPTEDDVIEGKAAYQETLHVINNDTIKTYKIIWKNNYALH